MNNPWKTISSKEIYRNNWIRVREDQVLRPDGEPGIYGVVETRVATGVIALTPDRQIYLVGQYRYPTKHYSWEIIEGGTDGEEAPLAAAKRELLEEAGLVAHNWEQLGAEVHLSNCFSAEVGVFFLATDLEQHQSSPDGTEVLTVKRVPLAEAFKLMDSGEIKDAMSIIALSRLRTKL